MLVDVPSREREEQKLGIYTSFQEDFRRKQELWISL
jgi:hypothetical protein